MKTLTLLGLLLLTLASASTTFASSEMGYTNDVDCVAKDISTKSVEDQKEFDDIVAATEGNTESSTTAGVKVISI